VFKLTKTRMLKSLFFSKGIAMDRLVGFQDLGAKDDFSTTKLENLLVKKGSINVSHSGLLVLIVYSFGR